VCEEGEGEENEGGDAEAKVGVDNNPGVGVS